MSHNSAPRTIPWGSLTPQLGAPFSCHRIPGPAPAKITIRAGNPERFYEEQSHWEAGAGARGSPARRWRCALSPANATATILRRVCRSPRPPGQCLYFEEEPGRRSAAKLLTKDAARRMRAESAVEPTRSENITVTWRRSAVSFAELSTV